MLRKFIERPVLSTVISIMILLLGLLGLANLPISQYPDIAPPTVQVFAGYQGANADVVMKSVVVPLEEQINGVENMSYMTSSASNDGSANITIVFRQGTDPDVAAVNVQNRVSRAAPLLPQEVTRAGVTTLKQQSGELLIFALYSDNPAYDETFLQNYASINILPRIKRITGVGNATVFQEKDYSMRIWLKPDIMASYGLVPEDISTALAEQNIEAAPGQFGEQGNQSFQYTIKYRGKLRTTEEFGDMVIRTTANGQVLRLKDIARIELGALSYSGSSKSDGMPGVGVAINQTAGSNARDLVNECLKVLEDAKKTFPKGIKYRNFINVNDFLNESIKKVLETLLEAFVLVFIVVFLFLQDLRSTLIPAIAVPVAIIGTFFFLQLFGFTLNLLTLFAMVLAIGIVVDDAIVVVEAVHAKLDHGYTSAKEATVDAMNEITGAIISITLVMAAVFIPVSFIKGSAGVFFKQFGLTLAIAILLSAVNALTLSPTLCALFLKPHADSKMKNQGLMERFHTSFNAAFEATIKRYRRAISFLAHRKWVGFLGIALFAGLFFFLFENTSKSFVPDEDMGIMVVDIGLPASSSSERTEEVIVKVEEIARKIPEIESIFHVNGFSIFGGSGSAYGVMFIKLKPWSERKGADHNVQSVIARLSAMTSGIKEGQVSVFAPPTLQGFGFSGGFSFKLQDRSGGDINRLSQVSDDFLAALNKRPEIQFAMTSFKPNFPQYQMDIDVVRAKQAGVSVNEILTTMQGYYSGVYASNFNEFGKQYRVLYQAEPKYRANPEGMNSVYVRTSNGTMAPITEFVNMKKVYGPQSISRFNMYTSIDINGRPKEGYSSGDALKAIEEVAAKNLPPGYGYEFAGVSKEEMSAGSQTAFIFALVIIFVYFLLCAQYESYILPFAVILSLPIGLGGALLFANIFGTTNNIYVQITLIMLVGLLAKNAILIVEFAVERRRRGMALIQAALEGAVVRLRPILMTSFAFIFGLLPLMFSGGAGAFGNRSIGTGAVGGMLIGTLFGIFVIPTLFIIFQSLHEKITGSRKAGPAIELIEGQS